MALREGIASDPIEVVGERVEDVRIPHFKFPPLSEPDWNLPRFIKRALRGALTSKPIFEEGLCDSCDQCIGVCAPGALAREGKELVFDYGTCIRCFCCQEVCPSGAITIQPGWAQRLRRNSNPAKAGPNIK